MVSLILWNMYFVLFSDLFADKANVSCRLPPRWALTELGLVHPTSNLTTSPGTNYLRALTCRPLGSVTLPTERSYWGTSQPECYTFSNYTIVVPFPRTWPCTFLCTHFSSPALHQKLCFAYLEECPGLTFNYHIDWRPNNRGVQTVSHGADMVNHRIVKRVAETKPEADAFARAR